MKKLISVLIALSLLSALCGCTAGKEAYSVIYTDVFDTVTTITAYAGSAKEFRALSDLLHDELLACHRLFDIYQEYDGMNNLCTVNRCAGGEPVSVDERILSLLTLSQQMYVMSSGSLNVCMGSILSLWHDARTAALADPASAALPDFAALKQANAHCSMDALVLDEKAGTVLLTDPATRLDVGAVAKGWAVQRACRLAEDAGYSGFLVSAGGNVCTVGTKPGGESWRIAMEDPLNGGELAMLALHDTSAVTSGSYQRTFTVDGREYCHIIDPDTWYPAQRYTMVTVLCPDSALADALSTSLFLLPVEDGLSLLRSCSAEALWLFPDGTIRMSPGYSENFA